MGVTVRSRGDFGAWCASFQTCAGGEVSQYTTQLLETRNEALNRMVADAQARGANAIVGIKFDNDELGSKKSSSNSNMTIANNATVAVGYCCYSPKNCNSFIFSLYQTVITIGKPHN